MLVKVLSWTQIVNEMVGESQPMKAADGDEYRTPNTEQRMERTTYSSGFSTVLAWKHIYEALARR